MREYELFKKGVAGNNKPSLAKRKKTLMTIAAPFRTYTAVNAHIHQVGTSKARPITLAALGLLGPVGMCSNCSIVK